MQNSPPVILETSLSERAYVLLREAIVRCDYAPGTRLKLDTLASTSGFSSSPLREALNRLAQDGLVTFQENRGFWVAPISVAALHDLTRVRTLIESEALKDAIEHGGDDWEARVVAAFHRLDLLEQRIRQDRLAPLKAEWAERHKAFHLALFSGGDSPLLQRMAETLFSQAERYRCFSALHRKVARNNHAEHQELMRAALGRDTKQALHLLSAHVMATTESVAGVLGKMGLAV
jgi:GntR family transcriptional regulator, carbon starvation induced regulator